MKNILRYILWTMFFLLSYMIPKKKNLYIFWGIWWMQFSGNSKALFLYCQKHKTDLDVYYMTRNKKLLNKKYWKLIYIDSLYWIWLFLRAKYILSDCDVSDVSPWISYQVWRFNIINLRHGDPLKKIWYDANPQLKKQNFAYKIFKKYTEKNIIFTTTCSEASKNNINSAFLNNNAKVTWIARNDIFFQDKENGKNILNLLSIENTKIICYTPTFRDNQEKIEFFSQNFLEKINKYCENTWNIFLIKAHHKTKINISENLTHIKNISKEIFDIQDLLPHVDVLITDYSSIYLDFLLTKKPIIFYAYDLDNYLSNRDLYYDYSDIIIHKSLVNNELKLIESIKNIHNIIKETTYQEDYKKLLDTFHKNANGWYCRKIIYEIDSLKK